MRKSVFAPLAVLLATAVGLSACDPTAVTPSAAVPKPVATKVLTLAQVVGNDFNKACSTVGVAIGYYNDVAWLMPANIVALATVAIAGKNLICSAPSGNLSSDLAKLNALWVKIQALTTVPK